MNVVPIADKNNTRMNIDPFTTHEDNPDGTIKQDLYRFIPPTVDNWFYYSAYFADYSERKIFPKMFPKYAGSESGVPNALRRILRNIFGNILRNTFGKYFGAFWARRSIIN